MNSVVRKIAARSLAMGWTSWARLAREARRRQERGALARNRVRTTLLHWERRALARAHSKWATETGRGLFDRKKDAAEKKRLLVTLNIAVRRAASLKLSVGLRYARSTLYRVLASHRCCCHRRCRRRSLLLRSL